MLGFVGFFLLSITTLKLWSRPIAQGQAACLKTEGKCFSGYRGSTLWWRCPTQNVIKNILVAKDLILNKVFNVCVHYTGKVSLCLLPENQVAGEVSVVPGSCAIPSQGLEKRVLATSQQRKPYLCLHT